MTSIQEDGCEHVYYPRTLKTTPDYKNKTMWTQNFRQNFITGSLQDEKRGEMQTETDTGAEIFISILHVL